METTKCFREFDMESSNQTKSMSRDSFMTLNESIGVASPPSSATGIVTDSFGQPLQNVHIVLANQFASSKIEQQGQTEPVQTVSGTTTNSIGFFTIPNIPFGTILKISHIGFKTKDFKHVGTREKNVIVLEEDVTGLDEVVISSPKKSYAYAWLLGAIAIGTIYYKSKGKKSTGLSGTKKRSKNVVKVSI